MSRLIRFITILLLAAATSVARAQGPSLLGLRSVHQQGAFHGLKQDAAGDLFTLFDAHDGVRILKLSPDGTSVLAEAHLGQSGDQGVALDVDANGYVAVAGTSNSNGSITGTNGTAFPSKADTTTHAFVARFTPALSLQWLSFVGSGRTSVADVAATTAGVYVTGSIYAATLPVTPGGIQQAPAPGSSGNGYVEAFRAGSGTLQYATYLTGANGDTQPAGLAVDESGNSYVVGTTSASGYPTVAALVPVMRYASPFPVSGFVTKLTPAGDGFLFSTFVPGSGLRSVAIDPGNALLIAGNLSSGLFPLMTAQQPIASGLAYQSAARLSLDGTKVLSSTLLAPADSTVLGRDSASRLWAFTSSSGVPPLLPLPAVQTRGNAYAFRIAKDGKVDRVARIGGAPVNRSSSASIPVDVGGVTVTADDSVFLAGTVTPTLSSDLIGSLFYDLPLSGAPATALPSSVRDATPATVCGGSACSGGAGLLARLSPDSGTPLLVLSTDDTPNIILRNIGSASANNLRVSSATSSVASGCDSNLAAGQECSLSLTGTAGSITVQADNVPAFVTALPAVARVAQPITIAAHELDFGIVTSASSAAATITVRNATSAPQSFLSQPSLTTQTAYTLAQSATTCALSGDGVRLVVPANGTCSVTLRLAAAASSGSDGVVNGAWQIGNQDVAVTGYVQAAAVSLSATTIDFGRRYVNGPVTSRYLFLSNASEAVQAHSAVVSTNAAFRVADECPRSLQPHSVCRITLDYSAAGAPSSDSLSLAIDGSTVTVQGETLPQPGIAGASANPNLVLSATTVVFADPVVVTTTSMASQSLTVTNTGASSLSLALGLTGDFTQTTDCPAALAPHTYCTVSLTFAPSQPGERNGLLAVTAGSSAPAYVALSGTGLDILPQNNGLAFGNIPVNTPGVLWLKVQHALVSATASSLDPNYTVVLVEDIGYGHGQPARSSFTMTAKGSCLNCWLGVQFTPSSTGVDLGSLTLASSQAGKATNLSVSGTGVAQSGLVLEPVLQDFGPTAMHSTGAPTFFRMTNLTTASVSTSAVDVTGDFSLGTMQTGAADCRNSNLAPGASCLLPVLFQPSATGTRSGQITLRTGAATVTATLVGTGLEDPGVAFTPGELLFDNTPGGSATQQRIAVTNTGSAPLIVETPSSSNPQFAVLSDCATLPAGASCHAAVTFSPGSTLTGGTLSIPVTASLSGAASTTNYGIALNALYTTETSGLQIVPGEHTTVNFGAQDVGTASLPRLLRVNNLTAQSMSMNMVLPRQFAVTSSGCSALPAYGSCDLSVQFTPLTTGDATGTIFLQGTPADGSATRYGLAYLQGYGQGTAQLRISGNIDITGVLRFGQVASGQTALQTLTLTNTSTMPATVRRILSEAPFLATSTCGVSLAPGQRCSVSVTYAPTYQVANSADLATPRVDTSTISIESDGADAPYFIDMAGQVAPARSATPGADGSLHTLSITQGSLTFPSTPVGSASASQAVTITNTGTVAAHIFGIISSSGFAATNDCSTLQPNGTCSIHVAFQPQASGTIVGALQIQSDSVSALDFVSLTGTTGDASVALSPQTLDFGSVLLGKSSVQNVTLKNTGTQDVTLGTAAVAGADFAAVTAGPAAGACPAAGGVLPAGSTCTIPVSFSPTVNGARRGTLSVATSSTSLPLSVALTGNGIRPALTATPASLDLGSIILGSSAALSLTLTNGSATSVTHISFGVSGPFSVVSACGAATLSAGASCAVTISFSPTAVGASGGTLTISSDDPASPLLVPLTGTGIAPVAPPPPSSGSLALTVNGAGAASVTVQQGLQATFSLLATPLNGFSGTVALTCIPDAAATYAACSLVPATLSLAAGAQGSTATVTTVTAVALTQNSRGVRALLAALVPFCMSMVFARRRRVAALLVLSVAVALNGCGSGGDPRIRYSPVGTYTFHVTATPTTGTAAPQDVTLTLVIVPLQ